MISKEQFAQAAIRRGREQASDEQTLMELYERYLQTGDTKSLNSLIQCAERLGHGIAYHVLQMSSHFKTADFEDYLQEISLRLYQKLERERASGAQQDNILYTVRRFYRLRAWDIINWLATRQKRNGESVSLDTALQETDDSRQTDRVSLSVELQQEDPALVSERTALCGRLIHLYLEDMLAYEREPQKVLAVCFARVLYQIESLYDPDEIVRASEERVKKDTRKRVDETTKRLEATRAAQTPATATSVGWAMRRMWGQNLASLTSEAQRSLQKNYDPTLVWGHKMVEQLSEPSTWDETWSWGEIVYTEAFTTKQTSQWSDTVHRALVHQLCAQIQTDPELRELVKTIDTPVKPLLRQLQRRVKHDALDAR